MPHIYTPVGERFPIYAPDSAADERRMLDASGKETLLHQERREAEQQEAVYDDNAAEFALEKDDLDAELGHRGISRWQGAVPEWPRPPSRRAMILSRIERHVQIHPTIGFQEADGTLSRRANSTSRKSLDPRVRDMWDDYDQAR